MFGLFCFLLTVLGSSFKSKRRLEAENAALRHQLIVLRRKVHGRVRLTNNDRWFCVPKILFVLIGGGNHLTSAHNDRPAMFCPYRLGLAIQAFPWSAAPRYLIRDQDRIYGSIVARRMRAMGIRDKPIAPASPWQNGFAERLIGSIRRECVDHFIVVGEAHLRRILRAYARYYNEIRTHWSLSKDAPVSRPVQRTGNIKSYPILGGLHHHYVRI
jgi:hypothetical protein